MKKTKNGNIGIGNLGQKLPLTPSHTEVNALVALYNGRRFVELESRSRLLVGQFPDFAFGWKLLGGALQMQGKDPLPAFLKAVKLMPDDAEAHFNLGVILKSAGQLDQAVSSYRKAVELNPDYGEAHGNLGNTLKDLGQIENAVTSYRRAIAIKPDAAEAHSNLGTALKDMGKLDDAAESYRQAVAFNPNFAQAYYNLGNVQKELGHLNEAVISYRRAVAIKPDFADAHNNLGYVFKELDKLEDAAESYRQVIRIKPDFAKAYINLAIVLSIREQLEEAAECYRKSLEIDPECVEALVEAGRLSMEKGEMAEAEILFRKALEINPDYLDARFMLVRVKKITKGDKNFASLVTAEEAARFGNTPLTDKQAISMQFVLGKAFDDIGDYDHAFPRFIEGCKLKRASIQYNPKQTTKYFDDIMRVFNWKTLERLRGGGDPSRLPIFVLGMPRSGTTLTEQIVASHPDVYGAGELPDLQMIVRRDVAGTGADFPNNISALEPMGLSAWAAAYIAGLHRRAPEAIRVTDKMPANFFGLGLIHVMLPNAKIIHVNRNPVDTCLSCFMQLFELQLDYTYDLSELGHYYVNYSRLMSHWRELLPAGAFLDVRYEDIVADQENQARRMIDFCGLDWNDTCIDFHKNKRPINTASMTQVRQPIYKSSVERWRPYEKFIGPLLDALGDLVP